MPSTMLPLLLVWAHLLGDFVIQTDHQAAHKPHCWRAMTAHLAGYHLPLAAVTVWAWGLSAATVTFLAVSAGTHAFLDRRWPVVTLMRVTGSGAFATWDVGRLIVDQVCHLTCLLGAFLLATALT